METLLTPAVLAATILSLLIGISLGLLGGGGSILCVPVLVFVAKMPTHLAIPASLVIVGLTSLFAASLHARRGNLSLSAALRFGIPGIFGSIVGARLSHGVPEKILLLSFSTLMLVVGFLMTLRRSSPGEQEPTVTKKSASPFLLLGVGGGIGVLTGFLGVGGGFLIVPALHYLGGLPMHLSVGTSLAVIFINSASGVLGHLGQVNLFEPALLLFTAAALFGAMGGTAIGRRVSAASLKRSFGVFVVLVAIAMFWKTLR